MHNIVLYGPPGSGKGTQAAILAQRYGWVHLSTGEILRQEMANKTAIGELVSKFIDRGLLVPDTIVLRELFRIAVQYKHQKSKGLIFDGFPRTVVQAKAVDNALSKYGIRISLVIAIDVDENELLQRILQRSKISGRTDDNEHTFHQRFEQYQTQTIPVIKYYKNQHKFLTVNGMGSIDDIFHRICQQIETHLPGVKPVKI